MDSTTPPMPTSPARRPDILPRRELNHVSANNICSAPGANSALLQHEIDMWSSMAAKTKLSKNEVQREADALLMSNALSKLRDLQKEISDTNWMFDRSYG
jgi:hypothetical protein